MIAHLAFAIWFAMTAEASYLLLRRHARLCGAFISR